MFEAAHDSLEFLEAFGLNPFDRFQSEILTGGDGFPDALPDTFPGRIIVGDHCDPAYFSGPDFPEEPKGTGEAFPFEDAGDIGRTGKAQISGSLVHSREDEGDGAIDEMDRDLGLCGIISDEDKVRSPAFDKLTGSLRSRSHGFVGLVFHIHVHGSEFGVHPAKTGFEAVSLFPDPDPVRAVAVHDEDAERGGCRKSRQSHRQEKACREGCY